MDEPNQKEIQNMTHRGEGTKKRVEPVLRLPPHQVKNLVRKDSDSHLHQICTTSPVQNQKTHKKQQHKEQALQIDPPATINYRPENQVTEGLINLVGEHRTKDTGEKKTSSTEPADQISEEHPDKEMEKRT